MHRALVLGLLSLALACVGIPGDIGNVSETDPSSSGLATPSPTSTGSTDSSSGGATSVADTSGSGSEDGASSSSGVPVEGDPCRQFETGEIFDECPEGCQHVLLGELFDAETCEWATEGAICASEGEPLAVGEYMAYRVEEDGQTYGAFTGSLWGGGLTPSMLLACTDAPIDDPLCHCLGVDLMVMQACGLPADCPYVIAQDPTTFSDAECALAALRDRTPASLGFPSRGFAGFDHSVFVHDDGTATVSIKFFSDTWGFRPSSPTSRCTLQSPQYFDDCIAITDEQAKADCLEPTNWLLDCVPTPPSCR